MLVVGQSLLTIQHLSTATTTTAVPTIPSGYKIRSEKTNSIFSFLSNSHKHNQSRFTFRAIQDRSGFQQPERQCPKKYIFLQEGREKTMKYFLSIKYFVWKELSYVGVRFTHKFFFRMVQSTELGAKNVKGMVYALANLTL